MAEVLEARTLLSFSIGERVQTIGETSCRAGAFTTASRYGTVAAGQLGTIRQGPVNGEGLEWYRVDWDYSYALTDGWSAGGSPRFVSAVAAPDLTATSVRVSASTVALGGTITVNYTLQNLGGAAPQSQTKIALVNPSSVTQVLHFVTYAEPAIAANSTSPRSGSITVPAGAAAGTYQIRLFVDNQSSIGQTNEGNDIIAGPNITVSTPTRYADLVPQNLSLNLTSGIPGSNVQVNFSVRNDGAGASLATTANIRLSTSSSAPSTSDPLLGTVDINALAADGGQQSFAPTYQIPGGTAAGQKYIWVIVESQLAHAGRDS